jgi:ABC-type bacteriocin/lantibiotic exporter with double-glycine peptidase domain
MTVFLGLLLSVAVGYILGPLALVLFFIAIIAVPLFLIIKALTNEYIAPYLIKKREKRKLKKILKERFKYLP